MTKHKASQKSKGHHHRERGFWLTALLVLAFVRNILGAIAIYALRTNPDESTPLVLTSLLVILAIADVVAVIAMWFWKQWGFYLFLISSVGAGAIGLIMTGLFYMVFHAILPPAILGYIIRVQRKWDYFD